MTLRHLTFKKKKERKLKTLCGAKDNILQFYDLKNGIVRAFELKSNALFSIWASTMNTEDENLTCFYAIGYTSSCIYSISVQCLEKK